MKVFKSSKNNIMVSLLWLIVMFFLAIPFISDNGEDLGVVQTVFYAVMYMISVMLIWILLDTKYIIKDNFLFYYSGPIRGKIQIGQIRKVENWNKIYSKTLLKPALGRDGLVIYYDKFDGIYISPENKQEFIATLREINPDIEVV